MNETNGSQFKKRVAALAVASCLSLSPWIAQAAGLGKITVLSGLGQPLRAELEVSASADELSGMTARLAPPTVFQQAGIDYASVLMDLRFAVEKRPGGQTVVKVSSVKPINEPFLDFLVELNWPAGRLVREYTFLLDPPEVAAKQAPQAPVAPRVVETPRDEPSRDGATITPRAAPAGRAASPAKEPQAGQTRVVKQGDTLRKIAGEFPYEGVSLEQMLVGLFRNNPEAFSGNNMNRLKAGAILSLPDKEAVAAIPEDEAKRVFHTQAADWNAYRRKLAATTAAAPAPEATGGQGSSGQITARVQEKTAPAAPSKDQVKVARAEPGAAGGAAEAEADRIAREKAMKEAQERVALLEKNVAELQKLVEMKNQQMAELQQQAARKEAAKPVEAPKAVEPPKPVEQPKVAEPPKPVEPPKAVEPPKPVEQAKPVEPPKVAEAPKEVEPPKAAEPAKPVEPPEAKPVEPPPAEEAVKAPEAAPPQPAEPPQPAAEKPKAPPPQPEIEEPGILDGILEDPLPLAGGIGAIALLGGGYLLYRRRRDRVLASETTTPIAPSILGPNSVFRMTGGQSVDTGNTPPQSSDFSQTGPGTIDTDEVDPVAEADVYMAYGRDTQAEEILLEAMQKDPQRVAIHAKLLEIYANRRSLKQFETLASELYAQTGGSGPEWEKVAALGAGLDPKNPLYSGGKAVGEPVVASNEAAAAISSAAARPAAAATPGQMASTLEAAADRLRDTLVLGELRQHEPPYQPPEEPAEQPVELGNLDFDLGLSTDHGVKAAKPAAPPPPPPPPPADFFPVAQPPELADNDTALDFDISGDVPLEASATVVGDLRLPQDFAASTDDGVVTWTRPPAPPPPPPPPPAEGGKHNFSPDGTLVLSPSSGNEAGPRAKAAASTFVGTIEQLQTFGEQTSAPKADFAAAPDAFGVATQINAPVQGDAPIIAPLSFDGGQQPAKASSASGAPAAGADGVEFDVSLTDSVFLGEPMASPEFDIGAINLDLAAPPAAKAPAAEAAVGTSTSINRQWEEVNTKLDLAKAYEEMGDLEGARELLQEVMGEGSPDLVEQAQAILARIGG